MIPTIEAVAKDNPAARLRADELLVVLGPYGGERASWVRTLIEQAHPNLRRSQHYLTYHVGFCDNAYRSPYVIVEWTHPGINALERRWVMHKLSGLIDKLFSIKGLAIFLEDGSGPEQLVMAEDLFMRKLSPRYDRMVSLEAVRILSPAADALRKADPFYSTRLKHQLNFRAWVNENPDELTSIALGERLSAFCASNGCTMETYDVERLKQLGLNLLLAVGQASDRSPSRLHIATHNLKPGDRPLMLVGKGVTFDTGGINLKPHESFVNCMKNDMGGAGLMINLFMALVTAGYAGPLAVVIPCCENLIGERAVKPGAIIKSYSGKDVVIEHTDAEGRLILADALAYAQTQLRPALTLVAATLTTASLRQFTNFYTPVHFAKAMFQNSLVAAGRHWGEEFSFWGEFLPFLQGNKTPAADLTNMGRMPSHASMGGGSNVAAHFLREFAKFPLIHFDIFASTWNWSGDYPGAHYGATGAPFNSLFQTLHTAGDDLWGYRD